MDAPRSPAPGPGEAIDIAPGVLWLRLSMPYMMGHVNAFALDGEDGWTLVDAGANTDMAVSEWETLLAGPLSGRPVARLIVTHHHPDHIGLAAWLMARTGAPLWCARIGWHHAMSLQRHAYDDPPEALVTFNRRNGFDPEQMGAYRKRAALNFNKMIGELPYGYRALRAGERLIFGGRHWHVAFAQGHAPDQVLLRSDDGLLIAGDAVLPGAPAPLSVYPPEPEADPVGEFFDWAGTDPFDEDALVLPGHGAPFRDPAGALARLVTREEGRRDRLLAHLATPGRVVDCFPALFRREIGPRLLGLATGQALAHLNHLWHQGAARRTMGTDGSWRFEAVKEGSS